MSKETTRRQTFIDATFGEGQILNLPDPNTSGPRSGFCFGGKMTEMLPGTELDWLMAEQIMEWVREEGDWIRSDGRRMGYTYTWEPSIHIAHAWQVVKKLDLLIIGFDFRDGHVTCRMISTKFGIAECTGETEAHAICLTAVALMKEFNGAVPS